MSKNRDSQRLEWIVAHDASFGRSGSMEIDLGTGAIRSSAESRFLRVPCKHTYEWHIWEGKPWRDLVDDAMQATGCALIDGEDGTCVNATFDRNPSDHPLWHRIRELEAQLAALNATASPTDPAQLEISPVDSAPIPSERNR